MLRKYTTFDFSGPDNVVLDVSILKSAMVLTKNTDSILRRWLWWNPSILPTGPPCGHIVKNFPSVQFFIEGLDLASFYDLELSRLPSPLLIPWKTIRFDPSQWKFPNSKRVILGSRELDALHLVNAEPTHRATIHDWDISDGDRLPPAKELILDGYNWRHSPQVAANFWNWTAMLRLELRNVCIVRILRAVPTEQLVQLQSLVLDDHCDTRHDEANELMCDLLSHVRALEKLRMKCTLRSAIPTILKYVSRLRFLDLRDYSGPVSSQWLTLSEEDLDGIRRTCPHLMELVLDVKFGSHTSLHKPDQMIENTLTEFRNLRRLTIHTRIKANFICSVPDEVLYRPTHDAVRS